MNEFDQQLARELNVENLQTSWENMQKHDLKPPDLQEEHEGHNALDVQMPSPPDQYNVRVSNLQTGEVTSETVGSYSREDAQKVALSRVFHERGWRKAEADVPKRTDETNI